MKNWFSNWFSNWLMLIKNYQSIVVWIISETTEKIFLIMKILCEIDQFKTNELITQRTDWRKNLETKIIQMKNNINYKLL